MLVDVFYENVMRAKCENTLFETHDGPQAPGENLVLQFLPSNGQLLSSHVSRQSGRRPVNRIYARLPPSQTSRLPK